MVWLIYVEICISFGTINVSEHSLIKSITNLEYLHVLEKLHGIQKNTVSTTKSGNKGFSFLDAL